MNHPTVKPAFRFLRAVRCVLSAALGAGCALTVHAAIVPIAWTAQGEFAHEASIAPGRFVEVCGTLAIGAQVARRFETSEPTRFNIHYHVGRDVVYPVRQDGVSSAQGVLDVKAEPDHCWMWSNRGAGPAALRLHLRRTP